MVATAVTFPATNTTAADPAGSVRPQSWPLPDWRSVQPSRPRAATPPPLQSMPLHHPNQCRNQHTTSGITAILPASIIPIPMLAPKDGKPCPPNKRKTGHQGPLIIVGTPPSKRNYLNGCCFRIVSSRSGPVETIAIGTSHKTSSRFK